MTNCNSCKNYPSVNLQWIVLHARIRRKEFDERNDMNNMVKLSEHVLHCNRFTCHEKHRQVCKS